MANMFSRKAEKVMGSFFLYLRYRHQIDTDVSQTRWGIIGSVLASATFFLSIFVSSIIAMLSIAGGEVMFPLWLIITLIVSGLLGFTFLVFLLLVVWYFIKHPPKDEIKNELAKMNTDINTQFTRLTKAINELIAEIQKGQNEHNTESK